MPRKEVHDAFERLLLGKTTNMSDLMDSMSPILHGQHRVFGHDPLQIGILSIFGSGSFIENMSAGLLHLALDEIYSDGKKKLRNEIKRRKIKK